jgi:competence protein ComEC
VNIAADARLALPALTGWGALVVVLNLGAEDATATAAWAWIVLALTACGALFTVRRTPTVALSLLLATAVLLGLALRAPTHVVLEPWQQPAEPTPWIFSWADPLRSTLLNASSSLPGTGGQLMPGLAIGDTSRVSQALLVDMKTSSLTHITAVSGANCAIVTASIVMIGARLHVPRRIRLVAAMLALVAFVVVVTPQPSVVRAAVMSIVVLITLFSGRPGSGLPMLALAMTAILLWNPWWAIDYGFVLSVAATLGLLVFSGPLTQRLSQWMPNVLAAVLAIPLAAQLLCQPVIILLTPQIPTYGILANVIAGPAAPLATVAGLLACLTLPVIPPVGIILMWITWLPAEWIGQTATLCASLPLPRVPWLAGWFGAGVACAASALILIVLLSRSWIRRRLALVFLAGGSVVLTFMGLFSTIVAQPGVPADWSLVACDVGQGDAVAVRSGGAIALIDTGRDVGKLEHCLSALHAPRLDLLVLTHFDQDHVGAVKALYGKVGTAIVGPPEDARGDEIVRQLAAGGAQIVHGTQGLSGKLADATWSVLWPAPGNPRMQSGNPGSVTVLMQQPGLTSLFLGDLGEDAQNALLASVSVPHVDVVKVAHHGSADQSPALYERIQARIDVISVGQENSYGHPTAKTLELLRRLGGMVVRTDRAGMIAITSNGGELSMWSEHAG